MMGTLRQGNGFTVSILLLLLLLIIPVSSQGGIFSMLGKAARKADVDVGDLHKLDMELPDVPAGKADLYKLTLDLDGNWQARGSSHQRLGEADLQQLMSADGRQPVLIVEPRDLPDDLSRLQGLPEHLPLYIKTKGKPVALSRGEAGWVLKAQKLQLTVDNGFALQEALWLLKRPWRSGTLYIGGLPKMNGTAAQRLSMTDFLQKPSRYRYRTLLLPGEITDAGFRIPGDGHRPIPLDQLKQIAEEQDINLMLLPAHSSKAVKKIADKVYTAAQDALPGQTFGELYNTLNVTDTPLHLRVASSGSSQVVVSPQLAVQRAASETGKSMGLLDGSVELTGHLILHGSRLYRPNSERDSELKDRMVEGVPSVIQLYLLVSIVAASLAFGNTRAAWHLFWPPRGRERFSSRIVYYSYVLLRGIPFLLFAALVGVPVLIFTLVWNLYRIVRAVLFGIWRVIHFLVVRPVLFLRRVMS